MSTKIKTYFFVDGSNLYAGQYELFGPKKYLNFSEMINQIQNNLNIDFDTILFYASYSPKLKYPTKKQKNYLKNEALFYRNVKKTPHVQFIKGYRSKTSGKEKEVDVKLAVDIVDFGHRNKYQNIYLMSGDADFLQALFTIQKLNKRIELLCLENKILIKGSFYYKTHIIQFNKSKFVFQKHQRVHFIRFNQNKIVLSIE